MEKIRFTRNMLTGKPVIKIGYCGAYNLLRGLEPVGYMAGVYGWNCDVYDAGAAWIVTGYRFYGIRGVYVNYDALQQAENIAAEAWSGCSWLDFDRIRAELNKVLSEMIQHSLSK